MRKTTFYFLYIEILDIITTVVGFNLGLWEINPLTGHIGFREIVLCKTIIVLFVALALEKKKEFWFDWFVIFIALLPVMWNAFNFLMTFPIIWNMFSLLTDKIILKFTP